MKIRFTKDKRFASGVQRRIGDVRDYPDGMADVLIRRGLAERFAETDPPAWKPKKTKRDDP